MNSDQEFYPNHNLLISMDITIVKLNVVKVSQNGSCMRSKSGHKSKVSAFPLPLSSNWFKLITAGRIRMSPLPLRIPTTQPAFIEWQSTIHRSPPLLKFWVKMPKATNKVTLQEPQLGSSQISQNLQIKKPVSTDLNQFMLISQNWLIYSQPQKRHGQKNYNFLPFFAKLTLKMI